MAEGLPPLILEIRARGSQLYAEMKKVKGAVTEVTDETGKKTKVAASGWDKFQMAGKAAAIGVVGAAATIGVASIKMAGDFQAQVMRLHTAAGESQANMQMVGDGILKVARDTGTSTTELTSGMYQIESAGFHGADGLKVLQAAAEGAKNEGADMGSVGNALTTVMEDLGAKSGDAANLMSQMVAAVGQGKMTMNDLAGSIHTVLPNAAALGLAFPQVAGALSTMTAEGVSAEQAAQNLNHTIVKLAAPTTAMSNAMAAYGVNANDLKDNLGKNGLTGTFDILSNAILQHMGPSGLALMDTFNKSKVAADDVQKMLTNLPPSIQKMAKGFLDGSVGMKSFQKAGKELGAAGSSQVASFIKQAQAANGFSDALKSGKSDAQTFNQAMYSMLGDQTGLQVALHLTGDHMATFKHNVDVIGKASAQANGHVKDWAETQGTFNNRMSRLKETVQTAAIAIGEKLLPPVSTFVGFLANHQGVMIAFAAIITGVLVVAAAAWAVSMASAAVATIAATWPILAIIAAVAAVGVAIYEFATHWHQIWDAVKGAASAVWDWLKGAASAFVDAVFGPIKAALHVVESAWNTVWGGITGAFHAVVSFIQEHAKMIVGALFILFPPLGLLVAGIHWLATHWQQVMDAIGAATHWVYASVIKPVGDWIVNNVFHPVASAVQWLGGVFSSAWNAIGAGISWAYNSVIRPVASWIMDNAIRPVGAAIQWLGGVWNGIWNGISSAVQSVWNFIKPIFDAIGSAVSKVTGAISAVKNTVGGALSSVGSFLGFDNGGRVPGPLGAPRLAVVHGGEYVLSNDMQAGRQAVDDGLLSSAKSANGYQPAAGGPSLSQLALTGGGAPTPSSSSGGGAPVVNVYAQTNADPHRIAADVGWALRAMA